MPRSEPVILEFDVRDPVYQQGRWRWIDNVLEQVIEIGASEPVGPGRCFYPRRRAVADGAGLIKEFPAMERSARLWRSIESSDL